MDFDKFILIVCSILFILWVNWFIKSIEKCDAKHDEERKLNSIVNINEELLNRRVGIRNPLYGTDREFYQNYIKKFDDGEL